MSRYPKTIYAPCLNHMKRATTQTRKDYGLKVLTKILSLYEVPELRNYENIRGGGICRFLPVRIKRFQIHVRIRVKVIYYKC